MAEWGSAGSPLRAAQQSKYLSIAHPTPRCLVVYTLFTAGINSWPLKRIIRIWEGLVYKGATGWGSNPLALSHSHGETPLQPWLDTCQGAPRALYSHTARWSPG